MAMTDTRGARAGAPKEPRPAVLCAPILITPVVIGWPIFDQHAAATAYTPAEMAKELTKTYAADGERLTGVTCTKRDPVTFRCKGNQRPNPDQLYSSYPQATPTEAKEWADEQTGPLALTVTVEPDGA